jgi:hypothetical protein
MSTVSVSTPFPIFTDIDGQPLENGYIWVGTANLNPIVNPINVYWDAALTIPAAQPIRTLGGYPINNGTPARIYVNSQYSIQVQNRNGSVVYSAPVDTEFMSSANVSYTPAGTGAVATTVQTKLRESVSVFDFMTAAQIADVQARTLSTDVTFAIQAALTYAAANYRDLYFPSGNYRVTSNITVPLTANNMRSYRLTGDGKDHETIITLDGAAVTTGFSFISSGVGVYQFWGEISGIKFTCVNSAARAVTFNYAHSPHIVGCAFNGATGTALLLQNCNQPVVEKCFFINNGSAALAQIQLDRCTAVSWLDNYVAEGNVGAIAGLDIDRNNTGLFSGGAIESTGIPIRVCAATDAAIGCQDLTFLSINLENPSTCYFKMGYGWTGAGQGVKNIVIKGCRGYTSSSTTVTIGVDLKSCTSVEITQSQFSVITAADCVFNLNGFTNTSIYIGQQRAQYGNSYPWVKQNSAHVLLASPQYDWNSAWPFDQIVFGSVSTTTATLNNQIFAAQGGFYNVINLTNAAPQTINRTIAIPNVTGLRLTLIATDGNSTIAHLGGGGAGQFRNKSGANITLSANQCLEYRYNGNDGNWTQVA